MQGCRSARGIASTHKDVFWPSRATSMAIAAPLFNPALISPQDQENRMHRLRPSFAVTFVVLAGLVGFCLAQKVAPARAPGNAVLWTEPSDIRSRNLFFGPGGEEGQPQEPVEFQQEDTGGTSPKFTVRDAADKKWTAKLGLEAQPETAATRLLWAIGYIANENYFF